MKPRTFIAFISKTYQDKSGKFKGQESVINSWVDQANAIFAKQPFTGSRNSNTDRKDAKRHCQEQISKGPHRFLIASFKEVFP